MAYFKSYKHVNESANEPKDPRKFNPGDLVMLAQKTYASTGSYSYTNSGGIIAKIREVHSEKTNSKRWCYRVDMVYGCALYESRESRRQYGGGWNTKIKLSYDSSMLVYEKDLTTDRVDEFLNIIKRGKAAKPVAVGKGTGPFHSNLFKHVTIPAGTKLYQMGEGDSFGKEYKTTSKDTSEPISTWAVNLTLLKQQPCYVFEELDRYGGIEEKSLIIETKLSPIVYEELCKALAEKLGLNGKYGEVKYKEHDHELVFDVIRVQNLITSTSKEKGLLFRSEKEFNEFRKDFLSLIEKHRNDSLQGLLDIQANVFDVFNDRFQDTVEISQDKILPLARAAKIDLEAVKHKVRGEELGAELDLT